jgi:hypothetical protein
MRRMAPNAAACAECRRMAPDEARRCLMKLLKLQRGPKGAIHCAPTPWKGQFHKF